MPARPRPHSSRQADGYSTVIGQDLERPPPLYDISVERRVTLQPGDVLFIPSHWGHQTFTGLDGPSASFALWFFPYTAISSAYRGPPPKDLRGGKYREAKETAANAALAAIAHGQAPGRAGKRARNK